MAPIAFTQDFAAGCGQYSAVGWHAGDLARSQFQVGPESLLLGPARDRILAIATAFRLELESTPVISRSDLLDAYDRRYRADFHLVGPSGSLIAGLDVVLPHEVLDRMRAVSPTIGLPIQLVYPRLRTVARPTIRLPRQEPPQDPVFLVITQHPTNYWAGVRITISGPGDTLGRAGILLIRSESLFSSILFFEWRLWLGISVSVIGISVLCWLPFVRGLTRCIAQMDRVTEQIAEGRFDVQLSNGRSDELGHLGEQINRLASRIQGFVKNQKRFLGDTAHELCAPMARVQFALGILEQNAGEAQRSHVAVLHEEVQEMSGLVNELLSFSRAGLDSAPVTLTAVDMAALVRRTIARDGSSASIVVTIEPETTVLANEALLQRALSNLLRNAVRYAGDSGPITIQAESKGGETLITLADFGPGLPESELEEVFAPFYRPEASRTRETGGSGLGLAIVRTCVEACRGTVTCCNRAPCGLEVTIRLATFRKD